jgi:RNA polymerase sigma factor (TIGR02999 family)
MARVGSSLAAPVTQLLVAWGRGEGQALEQLTPIVYKELRRLAQWHMNGERPGHTLQATALVNEAYLRLVDINRIQWHDRAHFFAMAARQMRRVLIDAARKHGNQKRGGDAQKVSLAAGLIVPDRPEDLVALDEALVALAQIDERRGRVVEMKFFGGLSVDEIAEVLRVSPDTVKRDWKLAKAWLGRELRKTRARPGMLGSQD